MHRLAQRGWRPIADELDMLIWLPREYHTAADLAANITMDASASWEEVDTARLKSAILRRSSLRICIDGGRRSENAAALGIAVYSYCMTAGVAEYTLLARGGQYLTCAASAFVTEILALEMGLQCLHKMLDGSVKLGLIQAE